MLFLMEMGFMDFKLNEKLLEKYKGNLQSVTNELAMMRDKNLGKIKLT